MASLKTKYGKSESNFMYGHKDTHFSKKHYKPYHKRICKRRAYFDNDYLSGYLIDDNDIEDDIDFEVGINKKYDDIDYHEHYNMSNNSNEW